MKILITGASGFIGKNLVEILNNNSSNSNNNLMLLTRNKIENDGQNEIIKIDLKQIESKKEEIKKFDPDVLVHMAWQGIPDFSLENCLTNLENSIKLFETVLENTNCKKIIVTGSCFEIDKKNIINGENYKGKPTDNFTWAKLSMLEWLIQRTKNTEITYAWARLFYVYGINQRKQSLIPTLIQSFKNNEVPKIKNINGECDFINVKDVAQALKLLIENKINNGIYNIGTEKRVKIIDIIKLIENNINKTNEKTQKIIEEANKKEIVENKWIQGKVKKVEKYKWKQEISLEQGIIEMIGNEQ